MPRATTDPRVKPAGDEREDIRQAIADAEHEQIMVERYEEPYYDGEA